MITIHYVENYWNGSGPLCGAKFDVNAESTDKLTVTCKACLDLLKQERTEQLKNELGYEQYQSRK